MSDEREKKSWREIDASRDRSSVKAPKVVSKQTARAQQLASKEARKNLETLFSGSKVSKEKRARIADIQSSRGTPLFYEKMSAYLSEYGLPLEWDIQLFFLDHKNTEIVIQVLDQLRVTAPREDLAKQGTLKAKLRVMALGTFDPRLSDKILEVQSALLA